MSQPIGVFDSGIGGLTVLKELLAALPDERFVYFGDTARVPYGTKSAQTVLRFSRENVELLLSRDVKAIVVACNTASAGALPTLIREFDVPFIGVIEPGVRAAARATRTGKVGVVATAATVGSGAYQRGIAAAREGSEVVAQVCPLFVPLAEEGWVDDDIARAVAERYLARLRDAGIDTLVLGCTHYPLLRKVIADTMGPSVTLVDSAAETAVETNQLLQTKGLAEADGGGAIEILLSDLTPAFADVGSRFLGRSLDDISVERFDPDGRS